MTILKSILLGASLVVLTACGGQSSDAQSKASTKTEDSSSAKTEDSASMKDGQQETAKALNPDLFKGAPSGAYMLDKGHGYILMSYNHQGYSRPELRLVGFDSTLNWNQDDPTASSVSVNIDPATIDSGVPKFDDHLRADDFFDVANNPSITFKSTKLTTSSATSGQMVGDLTIKGITKPVTLDVKFNKAGPARGGGSKLGFSAKGQIMRSDFDLGAYVPNVGNEVDILIQVEYDMK